MTLIFCIVHLNAMDTKKLVRVDIGASTKMGCRQGKINNEDTYTIQNFDHFVWQENPDVCNLFCAVYDGHGGLEVSTYLKETLHEKISDKLKKEIGLPNMSVIFTSAYQECEEYVHNKQYEKKGSTALSAFLMGQTLFIANTGDSRCIVSSASGSYTTIDHKPKIQSEYERVKEAGGDIQCIPKTQTPAVRTNYGYLSLSRTIGDYPKPNGVIYNPQIYRFELDPSSEFMVLASDGLWDYFNNKTIEKFTTALFKNELKAQEVAEKIVSSAPKEHHDDITVLVVRFIWE